MMKTYIGTIKLLSPANIEVLENQHRMSDRSHIYPVLRFGATGGHQALSYFKDHYYHLFGIRLTEQDDYTVIASGESFP